MKTNKQDYKKMFEESRFPQLYSKRGFEKRRVRFIVPNDRTQLAYATDKEGNRLIDL